MSTPHVSLRPGAARMLVAAGTMAALLLAAQAFPTAVRHLFCLPSAWLSGQFLGVPMRFMTDGFRLDCPTLPVDVTLLCSGATFFAMLFALLLVTGAHPPFPAGRDGVSPSAARNLRALPWMAGRARLGMVCLMVAYLITLVANTARIVLGWHAAMWSHAALPPAFHASVHLAVGIIVFSGFLLAGVLLTPCTLIAFRLVPKPRTVTY